jgi:hypothetical protein
MRLAPRGGERSGEDGQQQAGGGKRPEPSPSLVRAVPTVPDEQDRLPARTSPDAWVEDVGRGSGEQWYGGPGPAGLREDHRILRCGLPPDGVGPVRFGRADGPTADGRWPGRLIGGRERRPHSWDMQLISTSRPTRRLGPLVGGTVMGATLVATGLGLAFLAIETPLVSRLLATGRTGSTPLEIALAVWSLVLIAGACLAVAGTSRLAAAVASVRAHAGRSPVARMLANLPEDVVVATDVVPGSGRPIPELVIGPFGVAIVHEMGPKTAIRRVGQSWEARTSDGWAPTEFPLDRLARDADRVRHWLAGGDLDFVVRVYAALVTDDPTIARSPLCAVIDAGQIPAWIEALPRQRSFSAGRRHHLLARVREAVAPNGARSDW